MYRVYFLNADGSVRDKTLWDISQVRIFMEEVNVVRLTPHSNGSLFVSYQGAKDWPTKWMYIA